MRNDQSIINEKAEFPNCEGCSDTWPIRESRISKQSKFPSELKYSQTAADCSRQARRALQRNRAKKIATPQPTQALGRGISGRQTVQRVWRCGWPTCGTEQAEATGHLFMRFVEETQTISRAATEATNSPGIAPSLACP